MRKQSQHKEVSPFLKRTAMHTYQNRGVEHITANKSCALFLEMGL